MSEFVQCVFPLLNRDIAFIVAIVLDIVFIVVGILMVKKAYKDIRK
jgi:uncharacterized membrane protein YhdT